jgi:protein-disulfide isomerase
MFWDYHEILFANQLGEGVGSFSDVRLKAFAETLGLDTEKFNTCFTSKRYAENVTKDEAQAIGLKIRGTPSLFVNDQAVSNPLDYNTVKAAIDAALAGASK